MDLKQYPTNIKYFKGTYTGAQGTLVELLDKLLVTGFDPVTVSNVSYTDKEINYTVVDGSLFKQYQVIDVLENSSNKLYSLRIHSISGNVITCLKEGITSQPTSNLSLKLASLGWSIYSSTSSKRFYKAPGFESIFYVEDELDVNWSNQYQEFAKIALCTAVDNNVPSGFVSNNLDINRVLENNMKVNVIYLKPVSRDYVNSVVNKVNDANYFLIGNEEAFVLVINGMLTYVGNVDTNLNINKTVIASSYYGGHSTYTYNNNMLHTDTDYLSHLNSDVTFIKHSRYLYESGRISASTVYSNQVVTNKINYRIESGLRHSVCLIMKFINYVDFHIPNYFHPNVPEFVKDSNNNACLLLDVFNNSTGYILFPLTGE